MIPIQDLSPLQTAGQQAVEDQKKPKSVLQDAILVAMDGSPSSQSAARAAVQIARSLHLHIHGLYAADLMIMLGGEFGDYHFELGGASEPSSQIEATNLFQRQAGIALKWLEDLCRAEQVPMTKELIFGGVPELVIPQAVNARMTALGRRGFRHNGEAGYLGKNFRTITQQVRGPLIVGGDESRPIQRLLLAYHGSPRSEAALAWARNLQNSMGAELLVLSVMEDEPWDSRQVSARLARLEEYGLDETHWINRRGRPAEEITAAAAENQVSLIVMGGFPASPTGEWWAPTTLEQVLQNSSLPVLAV